MNKTPLQIFEERNEKDCCLNCGETGKIILDMFLDVGTHFPKCKHERKEEPMRIQNHMIRSLYRDSDKLIQTEDEQYISSLRSQIDKARTERDRESKKYLRLWKTVRKEFGDEKAWELIEKAEE